MKTIILNDTSESRHIGCLLTMESILSQLARVDIEVIDLVSKRTTNLKPLYKGFERADFLLVNGEGSIHHCNRMELVRVAQHFPAVLINCVYQENMQLPHLQKFKLLAARESLSATALSMDAVSQFVRIVPDMCFASKVFDKFPPRRPKYPVGIIDSVMERKPGDIQLLGEVADVLLKLQDCRKIVTGRFHGIVICSMLGIPFNAYPSNTWKNEGLCKDMGIPDVYHPTRHEALLHTIPDTLSPDAYFYARRARNEIEHLFDDIAGLSL